MTTEKRRVIRWRDTDRPCKDCGKPVRYGRTGDNGLENTRCMACEVALSLSGFRYPVCTKYRRLS